MRQDSRSDEFFAFPARAVFMVAARCRRVRVALNVPGQRSLALLAMALLGAAPLPALAQVQQTLEMQTAQGGPAGTGPVVTDQVVAMRRNTDNPTAGNTFAARAPAVTVTYSLSNQQYTGFTTSQGFPTGTGGNAVVFGATNSATATMTSNAIYVPLNSLATPANNFYTSAGNSPAGTRIDVAQNASIWMFISTRSLALQPSETRPPTNARVQMADLTLTFSVPVNNPVLLFTGMGGFTSNSLGVLGYSAEFDLLTPGLSMTGLSGNTVFNVTGSSINNSATTPSSSCASADAGACGAVRVNGTGISSLAFRVFLRGDGAIAVWNQTPLVSHQGDAFAFGVALDSQADLSITKTNTIATGPNDQANDTLTRGQATTYTLVVANNGADPVTSAVITDTPTAGLTCPAGNAVAIDYSGTTPDTSSTVGTLTGSGIVLGLLNNGETATLTFTCNVNN